MSFAAVVALIAGWESAAPLRRRLHERAEFSDHRWAWRIGAALAASLVTTLIASVATGAFAAYHFNRLSLLGVVANLWRAAHRLLDHAMGPDGDAAHALRLESLALVPMGWGVEALKRHRLPCRGLARVGRPRTLAAGASLWLLTAGGLWLCLWRRRWRYAGLPVVAIG